MCIICLLDKQHISPRRSWSQTFKQFAQDFFLGGGGGWREVAAEQENEMRQQGYVITHHTKKFTSAAHHASGLHIDIYFHSMNIAHAPPLEDFTLQTKNFQIYKSQKVFIYCSKFFSSHIFQKFHSMHIQLMNVLGFFIQKFPTSSNVAFSQPLQ